MKRRDWINLPNALTAVRILLSPALLYVFFHTRGAHRLELLLCLFLAAGLTDCLDGLAARKLHQITKLGKVLDPIADKLFSASVFLCLSCAGVIPWPLLMLIVVKELYMGVGATICLKNKLEVASDIYGKAATALFYPAVLLAWPWHSLPLISNIGRAMIFLSVALSILAAVHYTVESVKTWRERQVR